MSKGQLTRMRTLDDYVGITEDEISLPIAKEQIDEEDHNAKEKFVRWDESILHEDPYWRMPTKYISPYRLDGIHSMLSKIFEVNSQWEEDLSSGLPTYYSIFGLKKGASIHEIEKAYEIKKEHSIYPDDVIDAAYDVMTSHELQMRYNEALSLFENVNRGLTPGEKREITAEHDSWLEGERDHMRFGYILNKHCGWVDLHELGAPTFYEILGIEASADQQQIDLGYKKQLQKDPDAKELLDEIYKILTVPQLRWEYDFIQKFSEKHYIDIFKHKVQLRKKRWSDWGNYKKILLVHLKDADYIKKNMGRWYDTTEQNYDWHEYLPPDKITFYDILGVDKNKIDEICLDKKEFESMLRDKYRNMERTPKVNLAYSVLKNINLRQDYDWMLENHALLKTLVDITSPPKEGELDIDEEKKLAEFAKQELIEIYDRQTSSKVKKGADQVDEPETPKTKCQHDFKEIISRSKYVVYKCTLCGEINKVFK